MKNGKIYIDFVDKSIDSFQVSIKNIGKDGRSKIDMYNKDTKRRLFLLFSKINSILTNNNLQVSIEEYMLRNNYDLKKKI